MLLEAMRAFLLTWWLTAASAAVLPFEVRSTDVTNTTSSSLCYNVSTTGATALSVPSSPPSSAAIVPGDFIGFGFDSAFLNNYGNAFSQNLVNAIAGRIPGPIIIRSGGSSGDIMLYDPTQAEATLCIGAGCPAAAGTMFIVGPSYFDGFRNFPDQLFSFQAPMGVTVNATNVAEYVTQAYSALGANRVAAIALGNEPDLYSGGVGVDFTVQDYVSNALQIEQIVQQALGLSSTEVIFEAPDLAGYGNFDITDVFEAGLNNNGLIKYAAAHWYQIDKSPAVMDYTAEQSLLLSHDAIVGKYASTNYDNDLGYIKADEPKVQYILSETGSSLAGSPRSFQDAFDATLWLVDFHLYSMSIGVQRIDSTQRPSANHSLWVPDSSSSNPALGDEYNPGPQVRAPFYGLPMVADFIGESPGAVVNILADDTATAYAMYEPTVWWQGKANSTGDKNFASQGPSKVAIVNLALWASNLGTPRGSQTFAIPVSSHASPSVYLSRLHADDGVLAQGYDVDGTTISWAGETWSYTLDGGAGHLTGDPVTEVVPVCDGYAIVNVPDSEAVVVYLANQP